MVQTFGMGKNIYSVDMMFSYVNLFANSNKSSSKKCLKARRISVNYLKKNLEFDGWGDPIKGVKYSPLDVLTKSKNVPKKYLKDELKRIKNADLKYPIIIYGGIIVDGVHRLAKSIINESETINAYVFDKTLMKKFILNTDGDYGLADKIEAHTLIELFYDRFLQK